MAVIRVTEDIYKKLKQKSYEEDISIGLYVKNLLQTKIFKEGTEESEKIKKISVDIKLKKRFLLNIDENLLDELKERAKENYCSTNKYINIILNNIIFSDKMYTDKELQELHNSNYQLIAIGRNLNQIAKKINANISENIEYSYVSQLIDTINGHIDKVGKILHAK